MWKNDKDNTDNKKIIIDVKKSNKINYKESKKKKNALARYKKRISTIEDELGSIKENLNDEKNHADYELLTNLKNNQDLLEEEYLDLLQRYEELED
jgi:hypothetical protein